MIEEEPVLGASGQEVQRETHPPQEPPARFEGAELLDGEKAAIHQLPECPRPEMASRDPGDGLDVAQAPRALLDVRLQVVAGIVELVVAYALLRHLGFEEPPARPDPPRTRPLVHPPEQIRGAAYEPAFHEVGRHGDVAPRLAHALAYGANAVSDRKPHVPQEREKALDLLALAAAHRLAGEDEQIDVGARVQLPAAVAADRDERAAGVIVEPEPAPGECEDTVHDP